MINITLTAKGLAKIWQALFLYSNSMANLFKDFTVYKDLSVIPIWNYWHAQTDHRYLHCAVKNPADVEQYQHVQPLEVLWEGMQDQYLRAFGYGDKAAEIWDLRLKRFKLQNRLDLGEKFQKTFIVLIDKEIEEIVKSMESGEETSLEDAVASIEEHRKVVCDPYTTSAKLFFTYSERLVKYVKAQEKAAQAAKSKGRK